jgi:flavodoxin
VKVLVAYISNTGNTMKVAEAIYNEIQADKELKQLSTVKDLAGYDLSFIGFPIQQFGVSQEARDFLAAHGAGSKLALFLTHAAAEDMELVASYVAQSRQAAAGASVIGVFNCQGELPQHVKAHLLNSGNPEFRAWAEGDSSQGQPDATRIERARRFAREVMAQAAVTPPSSLS